MSTITLPQLAWYGDQRLRFSLPAKWEVETCNMAGADRPAMKPDEIKAALENPIGTSTIRELARGKHDVVIIFDDMTRVTRITDVLPFVLEQLAEAGIPDNKIRFICALGCHGSFTRVDFAKKLGEATLARFCAYNHNAFGSCTYVGTTQTYGTKVHINEEVMKCDLKIAIGSVVPHPMSGFGGGGKIILPGVASFETIHYNHAEALKQMKAAREKRIFGMGISDENTLRIDIEEAAALAGLDMLINSIVNIWGETVAVFAGALKPTHAAAIQMAKTHYLTPPVKGKDIVIANTYSKANEAFIGTNIAYRAINREKGGDVVLLSNAPDGQVTHYLMGPFGRATAGPMMSRVRVPPYVNHLVFYSQYPDNAGREWMDESDKVILMSDWGAVLRQLDEWHKDQAKVAVFPAAEIQYSL